MWADVWVDPWTFGTAIAVGVWASLTLLRALA